MPERIEIPQIFNHGSKLNAAQLVVAEVQGRYVTDLKGTPMQEAD